MPTRPTAIGHGALGDRIEAATLVVERKDGKRVSFTLPDTEVFEDRAPRIVDFDGFGRSHIVTIVADQDRKAQAVVVFAVTDDGIERVAQTPFIGRANRWLNIAGIADFDGSGSTSIALVETPHLAGVLQFWRWSKGALVLTAEDAGSRTTTTDRGSNGFPLLRISTVTAFPTSPCRASTGSVC